MLHRNLRRWLKPLKLLPPCVAFMVIKRTKLDSAWGSSPDPAWGANSVPPDSLSGFKWPYSVFIKERGGREGQGKNGRRCRQWRIQKFWKKGAKDNLSVPSLFIANAHNGLYAFYTRSQYTGGRPHHPPFESATGRREGKGGGGGERKEGGRTGVRQVQGMALGWWTTLLSDNSARWSLALNSGHVFEDSVDLLFSKARSPIGGNSGSLGTDTKGNRASPMAPPPWWAVGIRSNEACVYLFPGDTYDFGLAVFGPPPLYCCCELLTASVPAFHGAHRWPCGRFAAPRNSFLNSSERRSG